MSETKHRGYVRVPDEDVSETRVPTADQRRAIELLEYATPGCPVVRLSWAQWHHVDRVVAGLARMGVPPARPIPEPRTPTEGDAR